jgi:hypothetical protein
VALSLAVHHASVALEHHGHDGMKAGTVVEMCLGVLTAVGTTVAAVAAVLICSRRQCVLQALTGPPAKVPRRAIPPRVRAGPVLLIELCVCRC